MICLIAIQMTLPNELRRTGLGVRFIGRSAAAVRLRAYGRGLGYGACLWTTGFAQFVGRISTANTNHALQLLCCSEVGRSWRKACRNFGPVTSAGKRNSRLAEQDLFFAKLTEHLRDMAEFDVNTGLRDQELCGLQWAWEHRVPELDAPGIRRSVFVLPAVKNKNRQARVVVLNDVAQAIIERKRGQHPVYVFTWTNDDGVRNRTGRMRNSGWVNARNRATGEYPAVFGREAPPGFRDLRAHDLRHTFGRRLRAAGVSKEDRKDLLGHKSRDVTTDYSAGELMNLIKAANLLFGRRTAPRSLCFAWWRDDAGDKSRETPADTYRAICGRAFLN